MTRRHYLLAWICYRLGDFFDAWGCPTFARGVDWIWRKLSWLEWNF